MASTQANNEQRPYVKRTVDELDLLDDFLFQNVISRGAAGAEACREILEVILGRKIGSVTVSAQEALLGADTTLHGIRMDVYVRENGDSLDAEVEAGDIYDIEPDKVPEKDNLPWKTRYYHGMMDTRLLGTSTDYKRLNNVTVIMITPYDPFDKGRMVYTVKNQCIEDNSVTYEDGQSTIYLYTRGRVGNPRTELMELLKYMEDSSDENVRNETIARIDSLVKEVKKDREVCVAYMKTLEKENWLRQEGRKEGYNDGVNAGIYQVFNSLVREGIMTQAEADRRISEYVSTKVAMSTTAA